MGAPNVTFAPRDRLGPYELLLELAAGGVATVGLALHRGAAGFERLVVVKRVHRKFVDDESFLHMFRDEARLASSVRHPNVVPVIDVVEMPGELLLVMEYVESVSLAALMKGASGRREPIPPAIASAIVGDALAGLHGAHEAVDLRRNKLQIVHRDVSPHNIVVGVDGIARVIDFGIAKAADRLASTRDGVLKGKFAYMSPEQVEAMPLDRRSDVFSAGVVLHEALTGARLFDAKTELAIMHLVTTAAIPPPSSRVAGLPPQVDDVVLAALQRDPEQRFQSALAFHNALEIAVPPARARDVAAWVERAAGRELDALGARLQGVLGDELEKLSPRHHAATHRFRSDGSDGGAAAPPRAPSPDALGARLPLGHAAPAALPARLPPAPLLPVPAPRATADVGSGPPRRAPTLASPADGAPRAHEPSPAAKGDDDRPRSHRPSRASPRGSWGVALVAIGALLAGGGTAFVVSLVERHRLAAAASPDVAPPLALAPESGSSAPPALAPLVDPPPSSRAAPRDGGLPAARSQGRARELAPSPY